MQHCKLAMARIIVVLHQHPALAQVGPTNVAAYSRQALTSTI
jgi:hypothetical protein